MRDDRVNGTAGPAHRIYDELAVGYAVHALEPAEEMQFLDHLQGCARCEQQLREHADTLRELAYLPGPAELPAGLFAGIRERILADCTSEAAFPSPRTGADVPPARLALRGPGKAAPTDRWVDRWVDRGADRRARRPAATGMRRVPVLAGAAAALVLAASLAVGTSDLFRPQPTGAAEQLAAVRLIEQGPGRTVRLAATGTREVQAVVLLDDDRVSLVTDGLAVNERDSTSYVLWGLRGDTANPITAFDVRETGPRVAGRDLVLGSAVQGLTGFAITREPIGGPPDTLPSRPTQPTLAAGTVTG